MNTFSAELVGYIPKLKYFGLKISRDPVVADDLVQDTLELALVNQDKFKPGSSMHSWLYNIMQNRFIDDIRYTRRRPNDSDAYDESAADHRDESEHGSRIEQKILLSEVFSALKQLSAPTARTLSLVAIGHSYEEVAEIDKVPVGTVKSRVCNGRKRLEVCLT